MKKTTLIILSHEAEQAYDYLSDKAKTSKIERSVIAAVNNKIELIKSDSHYGSPISKRLIPKEYILRYGISRLFRVELPFFWRMLYTLTNEEREVRIIAIIMDIVDHKDYNKKFGYKNR